MRRITALGSLLLLSAVVSLGCKGGHNLAGKWNFSSEDPDMKKLGSATIEFGSDGSINFAADMKEPMAMSMKFTGTYTVTDDTLKITYKDVNFTTSNKQLSGLMDQNKPKMLDEMNQQSQAFKLKWNSNDSVTINDPKGKATTLTRVSS